MVYLYKHVHYYVHLYKPFYTDTCEGVKHWYGNNSWITRTYFTQQMQHLLWEMSMYLFKKQNHFQLKTLVFHKTQ